MVFCDVEGWGCVSVAVDFLRFGEGSCGVDSLSVSMMSS